MANLSLGAKEAIISKALSRPDISLKRIAEENNIGHSTLTRWLKQRREGLSLDNRRRVRPQKSESQTPPLQHILATSKLDEEGIGAYCREHGIHSFQLKKWQDELMKQSNKTNKLSKELSELKALRNENKQLKKELYRKEKALAETSALLILKKKANLIWGELGDD